jgi:glutamate-1-semialdehyde aminotransferase
MTEPQRMGLKAVMVMIKDLRENLAHVRKERDQAVERLNESIQAELDRDALALRVKELDGAVEVSWSDVDVDGNPECRHCSRYGRADYEHAPDCIVLSIKPKESQ